MAKLLTGALRRLARTALEAERRDALYADTPQLDVPGRQVSRRALRIIKKSRARDDARAVIWTRRKRAEAA